MQSPRGEICKITPWYVDRDLPNQNVTHRTLAKISMYKQKDWSEQIVRITLDTVQDLDFPIDYNGNHVTLHQALTCCRTSGMGNYCLFSSINFVSQTGEFIAVCVNDYKEETQPVIKNLFPICRKHFGEVVKIKFTPDTCKANAHRSYD